MNDELTMREGTTATPERLDLSQLKSGDYLVFTKEATLQYAFSYSELTQSPLSVVCSAGTPIRIHSQCKNGLVYGSVEPIEPQKMLIGKLILNIGEIADALQDGNRRQGNPLEEGLRSQELHEIRTNQFATIAWCLRRSDTFETAFHLGARIQELHGSSDTDKQPKYITPPEQEDI